MKTSLKIVISNLSNELYIFFLVQMDLENNFETILNKTMDDARRQRPLQEEIVPTETEEQSKKTFHQIFDPRLVESPMTRLPEHYDPGKHPYWKSYTDCSAQFIDPVLGRSIGFWDSSVSKVFFYDFGYMSKNPKNPMEVGFDFDPNKEIFKIENDEGNS